MENAETNVKTKKKMNKTLKIVLIIVAVLAAIAAGVVIYISAVVHKNMEAGSELFDARPAIVSDDPKFLNVAMYSYVPDMHLMEQYAEEMFKQIEPDVKINWVDWDCYISENPKNIDVFIFDACFLQSLYANGHLSEIDPSGFKDVEDIADFAFRDTAIEVNGEEKCFGVPILLCSEFLISREGDTEVEACESMDDLYAVIGKGEVGKNKGLINDFLLNYAYYYIGALWDDADPANRDIEAQIGTINENGIKTIKQIADMVGRKSLNQNEIQLWLADDADLPASFAKGKGRAYFGYSEGMSSMQDVVDDLNVKFISLGNGENQTYIYTDLVSINTSVTNAEKRHYCEELVELLTSHDYIYKVGLNGGTPAYLLPARLSIFDELATSYPMYAELKEVFDAADKHISCDGTWFYDYVNELFGVLEPYIYE